MPRKRKGSTGFTAEFFGKMPVATDAGKAKARGIAESTMALETSGTSKSAKDITDQELRREAESMASIADPDERADSIHRCLVSCVAMAGDAQELAGAYLQFVNDTEQFRRDFENAIRDGIRTQGEQN